MIKQVQQRYKIGTLWERDWFEGWTWVGGGL